MQLDGLLFFVFLMSVFGVFVALWVFFKAEKTAFHETKREVLALKARVRELNDLVGSSVSTNAKNGFRIKKMREMVTTFSKEVESVQDHCARLREGQIVTQEMISRRRPVVRIENATAAKKKIRVKESRVVN